MNAQTELCGGDLLYNVDGAVAWITLNRPQFANALTPAQRNTIIELLRDCDHDRSVRAIVVRATGKHFCGGADLRVERPEIEEGLETPTGRVSGTVMKAISYGVSQLIVALQDCQKPIVASVQGTAAGIGVQLAIASDIVLMAEGASFIEIFVKRGIIADGGAAYLLPRLAGVMRAKELLLLGDRITAPKALEFGLATRVVPLDQLDGLTEEIALMLAAGPTVAVGLMKRLANRALDVDRGTSFFEESLAQETANATVDAREGIASFVEKRTTEYRGY